MGYRLTVHACGRDTDLTDSWVSVPTGQGFTASAATLTSAAADAAGAHLVWQVESGPPATARIYRRAAGTNWELEQELVIGADGVVRFDDLGLQPGSRHEYRLGLYSCDQERLFAGPTLQAPLFALALRGTQPNPARDKLSVSFALESAQPARLEVFDMTGRLIASRSVGSLGAGDHVLDLGDSRLPTGMYLIRLTQAGRSRTARAVLVH
ncbi:MAG: T9SS type A sorting domain-containing protein [Candidatus Eisenbacteria bacterium]|uniref:T9SS type A sorting domain-containing protein n=1 Tax=Eiseniibacteriota bacterium TaxID=2212470 RepID=A0A538UBZ2_UNCEI|nr:MAG: T9SS type A sorting domain-containing protein [Candidatus Eisenbacteria bacterium]